jgi:site-specific DNA-methyltransferase (adenine-specific)
MGNDWDGDRGGRDQWIDWFSTIMKECFRVMKPGAHGLVWAIPRTSHWTATALEDAGFEVRDIVTHLFGSGFPKSLNISKAIDKNKKANRERVKGSTGSNNTTSRGKFNLGEAISDTPITAAAWDGWGTALKPASEHWILIRKPCSEKTVAANVLRWGVGGLNIDASRIKASSEKDLAEIRSERPSKTVKNLYEGGLNSLDRSDRSHVTGRFPANLVLSCSDNCTEDAHDMFDCPVFLMDEQSGVLKSGGGDKGKKTQDGGYGKKYGYTRDIRDPEKGGASRFFYCAKASKSDKNAGLKGMPKKDSTQRMNASALRYETGREPTPRAEQVKNENFHPTVKSTKLMQYLIRLITPPKGIVLDPFMGSGSTGVAAKKLGFKFIGIEKEKEYFEIAERRIKSAKD